MIRNLILSVFIIVPFFIHAQDKYPYVDEQGFIVKVGQQAPDFKIVYADGRPSVNLSDLRGAVVLLQFTASWCGVCRKEMPHIEKQIWQAFKDKGIHVVGIDRKETLEKTQNFADIMKISYPLALDLNDVIYTSYAHPNSGVTRNVLIDKKGRIVFLTRLYKKEEFAKLIETISKTIDN